MCLPCVDDWYVHLVHPILGCLATLLIPLQAQLPLIVDEPVVKMKSKQKVQKIYSIHVYNLYNKIVIEFILYIFSLIYFI